MWFFWWDGRSGRGGARFFWWFFFFFIFYSMIFNAGLFWLVVLGAFILFAIGAMNSVREFMNTTDDTTEQRRPSSARRADTSQSPRVVTPVQPPRSAVSPEDIAHDHALDAAVLAGIDPQKASVLPIDIGVIAYHGDETIVHRTWRVNTRADALQPFVNLHVKQPARGRLRFEIRDDVGQMMFFYERDYSLSAGENLIMPPARMPIDHTAPRTGVWTLRVLGDNLPLAEHRFEWRTGEKDKLDAVGADGEISDEMRTMLARTRLERMSLDELLGDQDDDNAGRQRR